MLNIQNEFSFKHSISANIIDYKQWMLSKRLYGSTVEYFTKKLTDETAFLSAEEIAWENLNGLSTNSQH